MKMPRTIATVVSRETAVQIERHLHKAVKQGAKTVLLYTSLDGVKGDPSSMGDFPAPDLYVHEAVYVIGIAQDTEDFLSRVSEHSTHIDQ